MAFNENLPANDGYIADAPGEIRANQKGLRDDVIVNGKLLQGLAPGNKSGNIAVANGKVCLNLNSEKVGGKVPADFAAAAHNHAGVTTSASGFMLNTDKVKLDAIQAKAEVNQNTFSNVKVGTIMIQADAKTDTLELAAGANVALTPDATNDKVTIAVTGTVPNATTAAIANTAKACSGNAATATKLAASRTINGVAFDGSANITITAAANGGTSAACTGNAATATKLATARTINGVAFDGTKNITITAAANGGNAATATTASKLNFGGTASTFNWSGQGGQPTWLWGGNAPDHMYVYNPANFNVARVGGYTAQDLLANANGIVAGGLGQNGWVKFNNGLILQWGKISAAGKSNVIYSYPVRFVHECFTIVCQASANQADTSKYNTIGGIAPLSVDSFRYIQKHDVRSDVFYIAIGR